MTKSPSGFRHLSSYVNKSTNIGLVQGFTVRLDRTPDKKKQSQLLGDCLNEGLTPQSNRPKVQLLTTR
ncbi:hypothetical protein [Microcoleus asticus]|uniref:hypothetical protein n=1 Tax=Microcoleus asticus TaxID=2815231 RepID=UPI001C13085E|nr:hypothetical protein [Microcoleus asticus]